MSYPNEYWKYPVSVFYHKNKRLEINLFKEGFTKYLRKLISFMFVKFIDSPTVNAVKPYVFTFCIDTYNHNDIDCSLFQVPSDLKAKITLYSSSRITKALLLLNAYLFDSEQELIQGKSEIEHIFPQSWQDTNYNGWNKQEAETHLNMLGNKIVFEKRLNIQAGNNYFGRKKEKYKESKVKEVLWLSNLEQNDWLKEDIETRNGEIVERLYNFFLSNLPLPMAEKKEALLLELQSGEEKYRLLQIIDCQSGVVSYKVEKRVYDLNNTDIFNKTMVDVVDTSDNIQDALSGIGKKAFYGQLTLHDEQLKDAIKLFIDNN